MQIAHKLKSKLLEVEGITVNKSDILKMNISTNSDFRDLVGRLGYEIVIPEKDQPFSLFAFKDGKYYGYKNLSGLGIILKTGVPDYAMLRNIRIANLS